MAETHFDAWIAAHYETLWPELYGPAAIDPVVDVLAELAAGGPVLEFGIGTGRIAVPLHRRGIPVHGIELSPAMAGRLRADPDAAGIQLTLGDFATATADGQFALVYLLRNTITNLTTQDEQVRAFANAAAHLRPGGCFVVENYVPRLRRLPPGQDTHVFTVTPTHLGYEQYDTSTQLAVSHHHWTVQGQHVDFSSPHRYAWPAELDLMARLAGMTLRSRWADWQRTPFTADSDSHISVWTTDPVAQRGVVNGVLYMVQFEPNLDDESVVAARAEQLAARPLFDLSVAQTAEALRAALADGRPLTGGFPQPHDEATVRTFLTRLVERIEAARPESR